MYIASSDAFISAEPETFAIYAKWPASRIRLITPTDRGRGRPRKKNVHTTTGRNNFAIPKTPNSYFSETLFPYSINENSSVYRITYAREAP